MTSRRHPYRDAVPIIEIIALPPAHAVDVSAALGRVATTVAHALGEEPRGTWALWKPLEPGGYAEGADAPDAQPSGTHPAIVDVFVGRRDDPAHLLQVVGRAVVEAFDLDDGNVVVRLREADPGHVWWGQPG
jgi:phenylpyruvate tautomerase PptA (4-oxalocrotonate tautomerase family)